MAADKPIQFLVPLTREQIVTLRSALDSMLYERSPQRLRSSGFVLDASDDDHIDDDPGAGSFKDLAAEIDELDRLLIEYECVEVT